MLLSMANTNYCSPQEPDEISLFLQQILLRSSSSSSHSFFPPPDHAAPEALAQISVADDFNSCSACGFADGNVSPSPAAGNLDAETDDCDYESEEAVEDLAAAKAAPPRCSSKRTRAAEVHNLSEKRRRSRINEKMKALQNLIPNSNKTDKASMLDEAIEYLKQLQLQVQMLTMRNGLSLYPVCLPGALQSNQVSQMRVDAYDSNKYSNFNMMKEISMDQNISADSLLRLPENCVKQEHSFDFSSMVGSKPLMPVESSMQQHFRAFQLSTSYKKKEKELPRQPSIGDCPQSSSAGAKASSETQTSNLKENMMGGCVDGAEILTNYVNSPVCSSQLNT